METRICKNCGISKTLNNFYTRDYKDRYKINKYRYLSGKCRKCENRRRTIWTKERARKLKLKAVKYFGGKCVKCNYNKCMFALEFDHEYDKKVEPSKLFRSFMKWEDVLKELNKCTLLCANCHREKHYMNGEIVQ